MNNSSLRHSIRPNQSVSAVAKKRSRENSNDPGRYLLVKRSADFIVSLAILVLTFPLLALIGIFVMADSDGPAIFRQDRVGKDGRLFVLYKFRTMRLGAPIVPTDQMRRSSTSYYTRVGSFLRRYSLDELPQLWNVLCGQMSLIGPRPSLESQSWLNAARRQQRVLDLRPGITGLAQVSGRDAITDREKVEFDCRYRDHCSFLLDCRIMLLTLREVITGTGAN